MVLYDDDHMNQRDKVHKFMRAIQQLPKHPGFWTIDDDAMIRGGIIGSMGSPYLILC